ncbi:MAG: formate dehydrogenase accessory sulfurtransferase FdhD [Chloroflexi bacterium]|nr:formate dehydrogenase accessory sulfurtransferase FdhD [Chloroflexota bacterium]
MTVTEESAHESGSIPFTYWSLNLDQSQVIEGGVIEEIVLSLFVNGQEIATMMCSPVDQEALALGFLFNEGLIQSANEVRLLRTNPARTSVDVFLKASLVNTPRRMVLTSGCGGGITFAHLAQHYPALDSNLVIAPQAIWDRMHDLNHSATLYQQVRGVHTSVLATPAKVLATAEDIGRHNTIDKLAGKALQAKIPMRDAILVTSGRISSEMLHKARRMGIPLVASRTAPTSISVKLAQAWNICVVGYVRQNGMRVYTHPHRVGLADLPARSPII